MSEIWTADREETKDGKELIVFRVTDEETGQEREERRYREAIPLMLALGGYPPAMGVLMMIQPLPWRFRKIGDTIYLDGPSIGANDYYPIDGEAPE